VTRSPNRPDLTGQAFSASPAPVNRRVAGYFRSSRGGTPAVPGHRCALARMPAWTDSRAPCGLGDDYESCCGRLHTGTSAPTAEPLMRSRYSAFAVADAGHLLRTWHPSVRSRTLSLDPALRWTRVAVLETRDCGLRRHRHGAVPSHIRPAGAAWRPRGDQQVRPARRTLDLPRLH
jgi:UPF0225 domain